MSNFLGNSQTDCNINHILLIKIIYRKCISEIKNFTVKYHLKTKCFERYFLNALEIINVNCFVKYMKNSISFTLSHNL